MFQAKESLLILAVPILLGGILLAMNAGSSDRGFSGKWQAPQFEFTIWTDTMVDARFANIPVIHISDREAARASMLVLQNNQGHLPIGEMSNKSFSLLILGKPTPIFEAYLSRYTRLDTVIWVNESSEVNLAAFEQSSHVIIAVNQSIESSYSLKAITERIDKYKTAILTCFDHFELLSGVKNHHSVVLAPNHYQVSQEAAAQLIFGGQASFRGIPEDISESLELSHAFNIQKTRLGYTDPEYVGMSSDTLAMIDQIISEGIQEFAMPGCQVLVAKQGQVVYHKSFGYHTYEQQNPVRLDDLYDVASITKIAATTLATMKMTEEGKISLESVVGDYLQNRKYEATKYWVTDTIRLEEWKELLGADSTLADEDARPWRDSLVLLPRMVRRGRREMNSQVFNISIEELLTHTSGLKSGLNIYPYQRYLRSTMYDADYSERFSVPVAQNFYLDGNYLDSLWNDTKAMETDSSGYRYSCVNMIVMQRVIDSLNQTKLSEYLDTEFYRDLGLQTMTYNPLERFSPEQIAPTSSDRWRGQLLCGTVHDPTAALFGGISGNAGLFSNAHDLGILGQMWLNDGTYGGKRFLKEETVELFTKRTRGHRGLGFDMAPRHSSYLMAESASLETYGHTGFTGTCIWVDPVNDLVFVFLSNRIHPSVNNTRLNEMRIRQRVHQAVYRALDIPADPLRLPNAPQIRQGERPETYSQEIVFAP